jgi:hypothetical protein
MFLKLRVADFDAWKPVFDELEPARRTATITGHSVHRDSDDPNVVIIAFRVNDIASAKAFVTSDDHLREIMQKAGVEGPPDIWFAEDVEEKTY